MTGASITLDIDSKEVRDALSKLAALGGNLRPVFEEIGDHIKTNVDLGFRHETDPYGKDWAKLSPLTESRRREGEGAGSNRILDDFGNLATSFSYQASRTQVEIGTVDKRAGTHQFGAKQGAYGRTKRGGPIPWGDIPPRKMIPEGVLPDETRQKMADILHRHFGIVF